MLLTDALKACEKKCEIIVDFPFFVSYGELGGADFRKRPTPDHRRVAQPLRGFGLLRGEIPCLVGIGFHIVKLSRRAVIVDEQLPFAIANSKMGAAVVGVLRVFELF